LAAGKQFVTDVDVKQAVTSWLQTFYTELFYAGIKALVPRWVKCLTVLNVSGKYVEVWCAPSGTSAMLAYASKSE